MFCAGGKTRRGKLFKVVKREAGICETAEMGGEGEKGGMWMDGTGKKKGPMIEVDGTKRKCKGENHKESMKEIKERQAEQVRKEEQSRRREKLHLKNRPEGGEKKSHGIKKKTEKGGAGKKGGEEKRFVLVG